MDFLDTSPYNKNTTGEEFLKVVRGLKIKGFKLIKDRGYFFIWANEHLSEYVRLTLMRTEADKEILFYWDLELSFKPFAYKHNHRNNAHIQSEYFNFKDTEKCYNYFLNLIDKISTARSLE